jgi:PHD/YefM family antitoxin component YafN of YafNO toxin-antitoxin module
MAKDPVAVLSQDEQDSIAKLSVEELKALSFKTAMDELENQKNKAEDVQLKEAKAAATEAGAQYKEATTRHKGVMTLVKRVLGDKGAL